MRTHWSWELTEGLGGAGPESEGREGGNLIHCHRDGDDAPVFGVWRLRLVGQIRRRRIQASAGPVAPPAG